jgi:mannosyl-oligosaccharide glucosidase
MGRNKPQRKEHHHPTNAHSRRRKQSENSADVESQANESPIKIKKARHKKTLDQSHQRKMAWVIIFVLALMLGGTVYMRYQIYVKELVVTPLDAPKMISHNSSAPAANPEKFWGTYRSNLYFGLKTRSPTSPVVGLMWLEQAAMMPPPIRHWCSQDDRLARYGWLKHDGINFGIQNIEEQHFNVTTSFVKQPGGEHGGDWTARISAIPKVKLIFSC